MKNNRQSRPLLLAALLVSMASIWVLFAPTRFGGQTSYIIVAGASMEPALYRGDLVLSRAADDYQVGDVATYMHPRVGHVIHRIIQRQGSSYVFKGDNNDWIDSYAPSKAEIIGKTWFRIPGGANSLLWLRTPTGLSMLSILVGLMSIFTFRRNTTEQKRGQKESWFRSIRIEPSRIASAFNAWLFPLAVLLFASGLLGAVSFSRPTSRTTTLELPYEHHAVFTYEANAVPTLYEQSRLFTGDAIFHQLIDKFTLTFNYDLVSEAPVDVSGTASVNLRVSEPNGWGREFELQPETEFRGTSYTTQVEVDLAQLIRYLSWVKEQTGLNRQVFWIDVTTEMAFQGSMAGQPLSDIFTPTLRFTVDDLQAYIQENSPFVENGDPYRPSLLRHLSSPMVIENRLDLLGLTISVRQARVISGVVFALALLAVLALYIPGLMILREGSSQAIDLQYGERIIDVEELPQSHAEVVVSIREFEDLASVSQSTDAMILHRADGLLHIYEIHHGDMVYRHVLEEEDQSSHDEMPAPEEADATGESVE